jgi:hypothetical protein
MLEDMNGKIRLGKRDLWSGRRAVRTAMLSAMAIAALVPLHAQLPVDAPAQGMIDPYSDVCYWLNLKEAAVVDGLDFHAYKDTKSGRACLEIRRGSKDGEVLYRKTVGSFGEFRLGQKANAEFNIPRIGDGTDLIGRGRPDMIVTTWSGGAHCCFVHTIFELKPELTVVARIDDGDGDLAHFADLDGDGHYYYKGNDWTFAYWDASFADSPAPAIVLRFVDDDHGGRFHIAMDKMRSPEPSPEEWAKAVGEAGDAFTAGSTFGDGIGSKLWSNMLNLIYTGHSKLAWKLLDETWPAQKMGKEKFLSDFCKQLKTSLYWLDIGKTLESEPPACSAATPADAAQR